MNILELSEQEIVRRQCLQTLREMGIDPYPAAEFPTNAFSTDIKAEFKDEDEPRQVVIAGRMMGRRATLLQLERLCHTQQRQGFDNRQHTNRPSDQTPGSSQETLILDRNANNYQD